MDFPGTNSRLVSVIGDASVELGSFLSFINTNKPLDIQDLRIGRIPHNQIYQYPPVMASPQMFWGGRTCNSKPSNQPRYILPTTAYATAKGYGLELCIHALREYARHQSTQNPTPAQEYRTCVLKGSPYAMNSSQDITGFRFIGVKDRKEGTFDQLLSLSEQLSSTDCGGIFSPERVAFRLQDSERTQLLLCDRTVGYKVQYKIYLFLTINLDNIKIINQSWRKQFRAIQKQQSTALSVVALLTTASVRTPTTSTSALYPLQDSRHCF